MPRTVQVGKFKAQCLQIMSEVNKSKVPVLITKHQQPLVKIVPIEQNTQSLFGCMKGTIYIEGDIIAPIGENWDADN